MLRCLLEDAGDLSHGAKNFRCLLEDAGNRHPKQNSPKEDGRDTLFHVIPSQISNCSTIVQLKKDRKRISLPNSSFADLHLQYCVLYFYCWFGAEKKSTE